MKLEKFKNFLESKHMIPVILLVSFLGWVTQLYLITIPILAIIVAMIYFFAEDVKNSFLIFFYTPFFLSDFSKNSLYIYISCIVLTAISIVYFIIKMLTKKIPLKKGKMFWAFVISTIAFLMGGIYKNFNLSAFLITSFFCIICYLIYWISVNFTKNLKKYLNISFICGAFFICTQIFLKLIANKSITWLGLQNKNVACIYLVLGIISCFAMGFKTKKDWSYFLISLLFAFVVYLTSCRLMVLLALITLITLFIVMFIKSENKKAFLLIIGLGVLTTTIIWIIKPHIINNLIQSLLSRGISLNGRDELWPWCWNKFKEFPIFGIGFYSSEKVPGVTALINIVLAHNTPLQWLTSLGIFGTLLMGYFYFKKYQISFKNFKFKNLFLIISIILIELSGITDQAATMDIFVYLLSLILISAIEKENDQLQ